MLTRELAIADYDAGQILPDRLTRTTHARYVDYAERMLRIYRLGVGRTRRELHRAVWQACWPTRTTAPRGGSRRSAKLLDDRSQYDRDRRGKAAALRRKVFRLAAAQAPAGAPRGAAVRATRKRRRKRGIAAEPGADLGPRSTASCSPT